MDPRLVQIGITKIAPSENPNDEFYGKIELPWYGKTVTVGLIFDAENEDEDPSESQIKALTDFSLVKVPFFKNLEDDLFRYFNDARDKYDLEEEIKKKLFPNLSRAEELESLVEFTGIIVGYYKGEDWSDYIGLLMECSWEAEHGLGVRVVENKVKEIGFQDIVI